MYRSENITLEYLYSLEFHNLFWNKLLFKYNLEFNLTEKYIFVSRIQEQKFKSNKKTIMNIFFFKKKCNQIDLIKFYEDFIQISCLIRRVWAIEKITKIRHIYIVYIDFSLYDLKMPENFLFNFHFRILHMTAIEFNLNL